MWEVKYHELQKTVESLCIHGLSSYNEYGWEVANVRIGTIVSIFKTQLIDVEGTLSQELNVKIYTDEVF